jgi:hypothetical protein
MIGSQYQTLRGVIYCFILEENYILEKNRKEKKV